MHQFLLGMFAAGCFAALPGCCNSTCCKRPFGGLFSRSDNNNRLDAPAPIRGSDPLLIPPPAGGLPTPTIDGPTRSGSSPADLPPPLVPESRSNKPAESSGKELILPDPLPAQSSSKSKDGWLEDPAAVQKPSTSQSLSKATSPKTVAGIAGFALVRDGVATGRKPGMDGFENLKQAGYRTVVYLHSPSADASAAKAVAEKRGFTFVAIPVSAENVKEAYARFAEALSDSGAKPIYICDDDGLRTGCLWYLAFRKVDGLSDDVAQVRAAPLGLRDAAGDEKAKLWPAVQDFAAK